MEQFPLEALTNRGPPPPSHHLYLNRIQFKTVAVFIFKPCQILRVFSEVHIVLNVLNMPDVYFVHGDRAGITIIIATQFTILI